MPFDLSVATLVIDTSVEMRLASTIVSISLLALPLFQFPGHAGFFVDRGLIAQKEQSSQRQVTDYYPGDSLWKQLDAENKAVINHFGFHALYELMVYSRRLRRGASAVGLELAPSAQSQSPIPDKAWFQLMNTSQVLNILYPQELREPREYGFDVFKNANVRSTLIEDKLNKVLSDDGKKKLFAEAFALNREEQVDELISRFMSNPLNLQDLSKYSEIAAEINSVEDFSPVSSSFLALYSMKLIQLNKFDLSLSVARKLYDLSRQKWHRTDVLQLKALEQLISAETLARSLSHDGRGQFKHNLPSDFMVLIDEAIDLTNQWRGPNSHKLISLLLAKSQLI